LGTALALLAGVLSGAAYCCVRALGRSEEAELWTLLSLPLVSLPFCARAALLPAPSAAAGGGQAADRGAELWLWFLALGLATQGGQIFLARGLRILPAASGTQTMYFGTVSGVFLGVLLGDGWPSWQFWIGGGIILAALHLAERADANAREKES